MDDPRWGLLLLNKPTGMTSHTAVRRAARALGADRAGHAGTLDPLASGLLLVGLGRASRLLEYLVGCDKTYRAAVRLGEERDTLDRDGEITATRPLPPLTREDVETALASFRGVITQIPPRHSAVKVGGVPLHRRARRGEDVEAPPRRVTITRLELISFAPPDLSLELDCSSGTYVRSLARDVGDALGTGACLWELLRSRCGAFHLSDAATLEEILEMGEAGWARVRPAAEMVADLPALTLSPEEEGKVRHGIALLSPQPPGSDCALFTREGTLLAVAVPDGERLRPRKVF